MRTEKDDLSCKPRPIVVEYTAMVKSLKYRTQHVILVYKCSGYEGRYHNFQCVPTKTTDIKAGKNKFKNHTRCEMKCVCSIGGDCPRGDKFIGEVPCPHGTK